jgi:hypothetical protein
MKTSILALAMGVALACPTTAYANENRNTRSSSLDRTSVTEPMMRQPVSNRATRSYPAGPTG